MEGNTDLPFSGLRVVDLSDRLSGAFAARLFGDFGAEVVLAEPGTGHLLRRGPALHAYANWNKRSVENAAEIAALVELADVVVTTQYDAVPTSIGTVNALF